MEPHDRLGAAVRARRRELGLNQEALAAAAGVSQEWVSKIERGTVRAPNAPALVRLAAALRLDPAALLAGGIDEADDPPRPRSAHARVAAVLPRLTEPEAAAVAALAERLVRDGAREGDPH